MNKLTKVFDVIFHRNHGGFSCIAILLTMEHVNLFAEELISSGKYERINGEFHSTAKGDNSKYQIIERPVAGPEDGFLAIAQGMKDVESQWKLANKKVTQ